jgi:hypothetical protein
MLGVYYWKASGSISEAGHFLLQVLELWENHESGAVTFRLISRGYSGDVGMVPALYRRDTMGKNTTL